MSLKGCLLHMEFGLSNLCWPTTVPTVAAIIMREASLTTVKSSVNMNQCHVAFEADVKQSFLYCNYLVHVLADVKQSSD